MKADVKRVSAFISLLLICGVAVAQEINVDTGATPSIATPPIANAPATLDTRADARQLFNDLINQYIRDNVNRLTAIDDEYSSGMSALSEENSSRTVAAFEKQRQDLAALYELGLDVQERTRRSNLIQEEFAATRQELTVWYQSETARLRDAHSLGRSQQIDAHAMLVERLQAEQRQVLQQIDLGPVDTSQVLTDVGVLQTETRAEAIGGSGAVGDLDGSIDTGVSGQPNLPAGGIDPAARNVGIPGSVDPGAPIDDIEDDRADTMGEQMEGGEESQRARRYESYIVNCPDFRIDWDPDFPPQWTPSYGSRGYAGGGADTDVREIHGYGLVMVCEYAPNHYAHQPVAPGQVCEGISQGRFECRQEGEYVTRSGQLRLAPSERGSFDLSNLDDVWWGADTETAQFLQVVGSTRMRKVSTNGEPEWFDCQDALAGNTPSRYSIGTLVAGDYFCYQTGVRDRYGFFRVMRYERSAPKTIVLYFETWDSDDR